MIVYQTWLNGQTYKRKNSSDENSSDEKYFHHNLVSQIQQSSAAATMRVSIVLLGALRLIWSTNAATTTNLVSPPTSGLTEQYLQTTGDGVLNSLLNGTIPTPKQALLTTDEEKKMIKVIETHDRENKAYAVFSKDLINGRKPPKVLNKETTHEKKQHTQDHQSGLQKWQSGLDIYVHSLTSALESHQLIPRDHDMYTEFITTAVNTLKPVYDVDEDTTLASGLDLRKAVGILLHDYVERLRLQISPYKQKQMPTENIEAAATLQVRGQYVQYIVQGVLDGMTEAYELLNSNVVEIVGSNEEHRKKESSKGSYFMEHYTNATDENDKKHSATTLPQILNLYPQQQKASREIQKQEHNTLFKALLGKYNDNEAEHEHAPTLKYKNRRADSSELIPEATSSAFGSHEEGNRKIDRDEWKAVASHYAFGPGILPPLIPTFTPAFQNSTEGASSTSSTRLLGQTSEAMSTITDTVTLTSTTFITDPPTSTAMPTSVVTMSTSSADPSTSLPVTSPTSKPTNGSRQMWDEWEKYEERERQKEEEKRKKNKNIGLAVGLPIGITPALAAGGYGLYTAWHTASSASSLALSKSGAIAQAGSNLLSHGGEILSQGGNALARFAASVPGIRELASDTSSGSASTENVVIRAAEDALKYDWEEAWQTTVQSLVKSMDGLSAGRMMQHAELVIEHFGDLMSEGRQNVYRDIKAMEEMAMQIGNDLVHADKAVGYPLLQQLSSFRAVWQEAIMDALKIPQYFPPEAALALTESMSDLPRHLINQAWSVGALDVFQDGAELIQGALAIGADMEEVMMHFRAAVGIASTAAMITVDEIAGTIEDLGDACETLTERSLSPVSCGVSIANKGLSLFERFFHSLVHLGADVISGAAAAITEASRKTWDMLDPDELDKEMAGLMVASNSTATPSTSHTATTFRTMPSGSKPSTDATSTQNPTPNFVSTVTRKSEATSASSTTSVQPSITKSTISILTTSKTTTTSNPSINNGNPALSTPTPTSSTSAPQTTYPPASPSRQTQTTTTTPIPIFSITVLPKPDVLKVTIVPVITDYVTSTTTMPPRTTTITIRKR
ncbi:hypothetical protein EG328_000229 [Venturia inaequalis]|uniref:Uncharacterized protein n=1 Tax=Venturia inaequalis TaxID=5025 RepID=A0A8H3Z4Q8_VENIN|nr:hypothetical protein EG328_000229 [Venturia inaequalis]